MKINEKEAGIGPLKIGSKIWSKPWTTKAINQLLCSEICILMLDHL